MAILNTVAQFGRYILRTRLAAASACEVWLAEIDGAPSDAAPVVFKKLRSELAQNQSLVESLAARARRASRLSHDCIARVLDVVVARGDCGFAMEFIDGKTLRQLISAVGGAGNALPVWFAIHVARCICQALEHAHGQLDPQSQPQPVLHERLCPENVFLTYSGQVKITDFGLSQAALLGGAHALPQASTRAPASLRRQEQSGPELPAAHHDLNRVGCVLYELLTGICPEHPGDPKAPVRPPSQYAPWVNAEVDQLIARVLAPEDSRQFYSAGEIRRALEEYLSVRRHDVSATHIAGLVSVLFSTECRDSAPPTMRLQQSAVDVAILRSRRTTPPDLTSDQLDIQAAPLHSSIPGPASSQLSRQTLPSPAAVLAAPTLAPTRDATPSVVDETAVERERQSESHLDASDTNDGRNSPFHHDWDLALKRAREEAQANQRGSGTQLVASPIARPEPPIDPIEQAVIEFERGLEHMRHGNFENAMKAWERALEFDPQHRVCRANLNLLKKRLGLKT